MEKPIFATKDIYLSAVLITLKFFMLGVDYEIDGQKNLPVGYFKFEDTPALQEARMKYSQGMLSVEPKTFITNLHSLKSEVTNVYSNPVTPFENRSR